MKSRDLASTDANLPADPSRAPHASRLADLPILVASLYHGFRLLIERLRMSDGQSTRARLGTGSIFLALCEQDDCIIKNLADRLGLPNATLTGLLDAMEKDGLVERYPCPDDGRAIRVRLTRKAHALKAGKIKRHERAVGILQAGLDEHEIGELRRLLNHVLGNLRADEERGRKARKTERFHKRAEQFAQRRKTQPIAPAARSCKMHKDKNAKTLKVARSSTKPRSQ
jgi:DNA-binding MarR family transcriptional regulator